MMYGYCGLGHGLGFGIFGGIFMLIFWGAIIWLILTLVRGGMHGFGMGGCRKGSEKKDSAMDILRERYAKGEISKEEFEEKSQVLK